MVNSPDTHLNLNLVGSDLPWSSKLYARDSLRITSTYHRGLSYFFYYPFFAP